MNQKQKYAVIRRRMLKIPAMRLFKIQFDSIKPGYCAASMRRRKQYDGIFASLHGGLLMTLADTTAAVAVLTYDDPHAVITTTDMSIRFLAPCLDRVVAKARVIKFGKTLVPVAVELMTSDKKLVAVAQVNYIRLRSNKLK